MYDELIEGAKQALEDYSLYPLRVALTVNYRDSQGRRLDEPVLAAARVTYFRKNLPAFAYPADLKDDRSVEFTSIQELRLKLEAAKLSRMAEAVAAGKEPDEWKW